MKAVYERPLMRVEMFTANQAVSTCTTQGGIDYTLDCMVGPKVDSARIINDTIASGCSTKIGYASGISTARDYSSGGRHSDNNSSRATWTEVKGENGYLQVVYSGAEGLLYTDGNASTDSKVWKTDKISDGYVYHTASDGGMHHMVAPVVDSRTINASW